MVFGLSPFLSAFSLFSIFSVGPGNLGEFSESLLIFCSFFFSYVDLATGAS